MILYFINRKISMYGRDDKTELMINIAKKELNNAFKSFDVDHSGYLEKN